MKTLLQKLGELGGHIKTGYYQLTQPLVDLLIRLKVHPNNLTVLGLIISVAGAYFFWRGHIRFAGALVLLGGMCDTLDGHIARTSGQISKFGALLDSSLDRYSELFMFLGLGGFFLRSGHNLTALIVLLALGGSLMVSYVRARAEGLGIECKIGIMQRTGRILSIGIAALLHPVILETVIWAVAILANFTAYQRMRHVRLVEMQQSSATSDDDVDEFLGV